MPKLARGMTLIEILVAMSLLAILSVLGYKAFSSLLIAREHLVSLSDEWIGLARVMRRVETDVGRLARDGVVADMSAPALLLEDEDGKQTLQLAGYSSKSPEGRELRYYYADENGLQWASTLAGLDAEPRRERLLGAGYPVRFAVMLADGREMERWPAPGMPAGDARALVMTLTLPAGQPLRRLWSLP
ncbi:PulJ/GspJ family protein [Craterilacuibacter sp.]|uniref:PulJ/GspJ family protein n=1 Tax=Craterilacuibacter sp. TaxID=2870909 RepID=UPI003F2FE4AB